MPGVAVSMIALCSKDTAASAVCSGTLLTNRAGRAIIPNTLYLFFLFFTDKHQH